MAGALEKVTNIVSHPENLGSLWDCLWVIQANQMVLGVRRRTGSAARHLE